PQRPAKLALDGFESLPTARRLRGGEHADGKTVARVPILLDRCRRELLSHSTISHRAVPGRQWGPGVEESRRHTDTVPATPFGMNRIESTRIAPNTGWTRSRETMPAMSGQNWRNSPPATTPHTDVMPPNTEPTRKRIESQ